MNQATTDIIEFLGHPELGFGADPEHIDALNDPAALQRTTLMLLEGAPRFLDTAATQQLHHQLVAVDWPQVAHEFQQRLNMASRFFDDDAHHHQQA